MVSFSRVESSAEASAMASAGGSASVVIETNAGTTPGTICKGNHQRERRTCISKDSFSLTWAWICIGTKKLPEKINETTDATK